MINMNRIFLFQIIVTVISIIITQIRFYVFSCAIHVFGSVDEVDIVDKNTKRSRKRKQQQQRINKRTITVLGQDVM